MVTLLEQIDKLEVEILRAINTAEVLSSEVPVKWTFCMNDVHRRLEEVFDDVDGVRLEMKEGGRE